MDKIKQLSVPKIVLLGFLTVIFIGTLLLMLPISSQSGTVTPFIDALFTATSATCVTGQTVLNTAMHWSYFGKTVIILLIELGGLGFMSFLVIAYFFLRRRLNIKEQQVIQESLNLDDLSMTRPIIKYVILFSFAIQGVGAALLAIEFLPRYGLLKGIYFSLFHSISAFCNAGFDLFGDSLISLQNEPLVILVIASLIAIGGLGFIVWRDLMTYRQNKKLLFHTKIVLTTTGIILFISFILFSLLEGTTGTFDHLPWYLRIPNYLFMAITPRTAGYANIDYHLVHPASVFLTIILMFIGGSSGSTAGGVKVTSLAVIYIYIVRNFQGKKDIAFRRTVPDSSVHKAIFIFIAGIILVMMAIFLLLLTETLPPGEGLEYIIMEVVSCFGTVGLSLGLTPFLSQAGKVILILMMFIGRVGLITFFWAFGSHKKAQKINYPKDRVMVG